MIVLDLLWWLVTFALTLALVAVCFCGMIVFGLAAFLRVQDGHWPTLKRRTPS